MTWGPYTSGQAKGVWEAVWGLGLGYMVQGLGFRECTKHPDLLDEYFFLQGL